MLNRGFNDTYLVITAISERYVFRLSHHRARGVADVRTETDFMAHLDRSGVPIAAPVQARDGALFVRGWSPEGVREGVLFRALEGRAPNAASAADARANGVTLAMLHNAADSFCASHPLYRLDLDHLLRRPLVRVQEFRSVVNADADIELQNIATRTAERIETFDGLTWTHCHGDCHGLNARITDAGDAAFFDFDDGGPGYLAYDLSVFLWAKTSFGRKLHSMWDAFVDGYRSVRPITSADYEAAHVFVIIRHIWLMGEFASRAREWGSEPVGWIAREIDFLCSWEAERLDNRLF
jgi:Ser/Thr protein kinase RdoA (MazF antagonist)